MPSEELVDLDGPIGAPSSHPAYGNGSPARGVPGIPNNRGDVDTTIGCVRADRGTASPVRARNAGTVGYELHVVFRHRVCRLFSSLGDGLAHRAVDSSGYNAGI